MGKCVVPLCRNRDDESKTTGISFHRFPREASLSRIWASNIGRPDWFPTHQSRICSHHFTTDSYVVGSRLKKIAAPTVFIQNLDFVDKRRKIVIDPSTIERTVEGDKENPTALDLSSTSLYSEINKPSTTAGLALYSEINKPSTTAGLGLYSEINKPSTTAGLGLCSEINKPSTKAGLGHYSEINKPSTTAGLALYSEINKPSTKAGLALCSEGNKPSTKASLGLYSEINKPSTTAGLALYSEINKPSTTAGLALYSEINKPSTTAGLALYSEINKPSTKAGLELIIEPSLEVGLKIIIEPTVNLPSTSICSVPSTSTPATKKLHIVRGDEAMEIDTPREATLLEVLRKEKRKSAKKELQLRSLERKFITLKKRVSNLKAINKNLREKFNKSRNTSQIVKRMFKTSSFLHKRRMNKACRKKLSQVYKAKGTTPD